MPKAAHLFLTVTFVLNALGWVGVAPFLWGNFAGYTDPSALLWLMGALWRGGGQPVRSVCCALAPPRGGTCGRARGARHQRNGAQR